MNKLFISCGLILMQVSLTLRCQLVHPQLMAEPLTPSPTDDMELTVCHVYVLLNTATIVYRCNNIDQSTDTADLEQKNANLDFPVTGDPLFRS